MRSADPRGAATQQCNGSKTRLERVHKRKPLAGEMMSAGGLAKVAAPRDPARAHAAGRTWPAWFWSKLSSPCASAHSDTLTSETLAAGLVSNEEIFCHCTLLRAAKIS